MYELYYQQTPNERYYSHMNDHVRDILLGAGIPIVEEYGGSMIGEDSNDLVAEAGFVVDASIDALKAVSGPIQEAVGRFVRVTEVTA